MLLRCCFVKIVKDTTISYEYSLGRKERKKPLKLKVKNCIKI